MNLFLSLQADEAERDVLSELFGARALEFESALPTLGSESLDSIVNKGRLRVKDLGLQAADVILQSSDPLATLQDVAGNFPLLAPSLSGKVINTTMRRAIDWNQQRVPSGQNVLLVDGAVQDLDRLDAFGLLEKLREQLGLRAMLANLGLSSDLINQALQLPLSSVGSIRVNVTSPERISFVSDVEQDSEFSRMPRRDLDGLCFFSFFLVVIVVCLEESLYGWARRSYRALLQPRFPGTLPAVRRNAFNAIFILDLGDPSHLKMSEMVQYMFANGVPLRVGIIPTSSHPDGPCGGDVDGTNNVSCLLSMAFKEMHRLYGGRAALNFLVSVNKRREARRSRDMDSEDEDEEEEDASFVALTHVGSHVCPSSEELS